MQPLFEGMVSLTNLFKCWNQFKRGKRKRKDIQCFERHLEDNVFQLHDELITLKYHHGIYHHFKVFDPKERQIGKASIRDRLIHQMVYSTLTNFYDKQFIFHSFSSRIGKGTHIGVTQLQRMIRQVSANGKKPCFALKMDIYRFFDTIDHNILKGLIRKTIYDDRVLHLVDQIIDSFCVHSRMTGIPLGNVTSQLFANIYLHPLDDFVKHTLRLRCYLRYCDDVVILSGDRSLLEILIKIIQTFLEKHLRLKLHPKKLIICKLSQGIDFVGYLMFEKYQLVRTSTKRRMKKRLKKAYTKYLNGQIDSSAMDQRLQSYLGILSHANEAHLSQALKNAFWVRTP